MKIKNAMLVWTYNSSDVTVVNWPDYHNVTKKYKGSLGACESYWHDLSDDKRLATFFAYCLYLIINNDVDCQAVKRAMLIVDEVRDFLPEDF